MIFGKGVYFLWRSFSIVVNHLNHLENVLDITDK